MALRGVIPADGKNDFGLTEQQEFLPSWPVLKVSVRIAREAG